MKRALLPFVSAAALLMLMISCNNQPEADTGQDMIENTIQSVSYLSDSGNLDPQELKNSLDNMNAAIAEIGYPDAGYTCWIIQNDTSDIRFMVQGNWPSQEVYTQIHEDQRYKDANAANEAGMENLGWVEYHRFARIK